MKKVIAFDLDDTLAVSKQEISDRMKNLLERLLNQYDVCVISGGRIEQFYKQVVGRIQVSEDKLQRLHLMPTCGTRYYTYESGSWKMHYAHDLSDEQKQRAKDVLQSVAQEMGIWCDSPVGEIIEDRHSQITLSALGQEATAEDKYAWAEEYKDIRPAYRDQVAEKLSDLEVRLGGTTSTDVTLPGIDKAYGMQKLIDELGIVKEDILFMGDKLEQGGNDFPVKNMGIDSIAVEGWETTAFVIEGILGVTE